MCHICRDFATLSSSESRVLRMLASCSELMICIVIRPYPLWSVFWPQPSRPPTRAIPILLISILITSLTSLLTIIVTISAPISRSDEAFPGLLCPSLSISSQRFSLSSNCGSPDEPWSNYSDQIIGTERTAHIVVLIEPAAVYTTFHSFSCSRFRHPHFLDYGRLYSHDVDLVETVGVSHGLSRAGDL